MVKPFKWKCALSYLSKQYLKGYILPHIISIFMLLLFTACFSPEVNTDLKNTHWSLVELKGKEVIHFDHQPNIHLVFHINDLSLHGSDGCNTLKANYLKKEDSISFTNIISTRMACQESSAQAQTFLAMLKETDRLLIKEDEMFFYHKEIQIAHFEAKEDY